MQLEALTALGFIIFPGVYPHTIVFNLQESGNTTEAAALAVVMMLVLLTANLVARKLTRGRIGY